MTSVPCANYRRKFYSDERVYELNTTSRKVDSLTVAEQKELIIHTTKLWLYIAKAITLGKRELPPEIAFKSVEAGFEVQHNTELSDFSEPRVTIFDWNHALELTVHSSSLPQPTLDNWWAMEDAQQELLVPYPNAPKQAASAENSSAPAPQAPTTPPASQNAANGQNGAVYTKQNALAKLQPGDSFSMKVVQIERHSKDGKDFYEFFEPYGGKAGQYAATSVFTDNEVAIKNGFIADLDKLGIKLGQALTGEWFVTCVIGKPKTKTVKGEEKTYTNIYVNGFAGAGS